jgi:predicted hydrocarbon binding protein
MTEETKNEQMIIGENFLHVKDFIRYRWGTDGLDSYNRDCRVGFDGILQEKLYPFEDYIDVLERVQEVFEDETLAYKIGWHRARNLLLTKGKGKIGLEIIDKVATAWAKFNNFGDIDVSRLRDNRVIISISNYHSHELYCARTLGFFNGLVFGVKENGFTVVETKCVRDGHDSCVFSISEE